MIPLVTVGLFISPAPPGYRHVARLRDHRHLGGDHADPALARTLRLSTGLGADDEPLLAELHSLSGREGLILLGEQNLQNVAALVWCAVRLAEMGADLSRIRLALDPRPWPAPDDLRLTTELLQQAEPIARQLEALWGARQLLLGLGPLLPEPPASAPGGFHAWLAQANCIQDFWPNENGLDHLDRTLLRLCAPQEQRSATIVANHLALREHATHCVGDQVAWQRLAWLSDLNPLFPAGAGWHPSPPLEGRLDGSAALRSTCFRRTRFGARLANGTASLYGRTSGIRWSGSRYWDLETGKVTALPSC